MLTTVILLSLGITALSACGDGETVYKSGTVLSVQGDVRVHRGDESLPAYKGLSLRNGDTLRTEKDSTVAIAIDGDKYILIEPASSVSLRLYQNKTENVALGILTEGAAYVEADTPVSDGVTFGMLAAPLSPLGETLDPDVSVLGGSASYRVETVGSRPADTLVQVLSGNATLTLTKADAAGITVSAGTECRIEREGNGSPTLPITEGSIDPYTLPARYIELTADGVFDASGNMIPRKPSGDLSLKYITVTNTDGKEIPLIPEFNNDVASYVAESDSPTALTVKANHPGTSLELLCYTAESIQSEGNSGTVTLPADGKFHAVSILVIAEDGTEARFSINIVPTQNKP